MIIKKLIINIIGITLCVLLFVVAVFLGITSMAFYSGENQSAPNIFGYNIYIVKDHDFYQLKNGTAALAQTVWPDEVYSGEIIIYRMGEGNDALGKVLIKGFLFAVSQLDTLPKKILFYNGGATLTCEGSDSLEDLKSMEVQGVEILTCGTCLDYYGLKEKLAVGSVTNMYVIVESMAEASNIIRP